MFINQIHPIEQTYLSTKFKLKYRTSINWQQIER